MNSTYRSKREKDILKDKFSVKEYEDPFKQAENHLRE